MVKNSILSAKQKNFLVIFGQSSISKEFYLTGGTALNEFYIPYRLSEDLDFFTEKEFDILPITTFIASKKEKMGFDKYELNTSFNRNIFFLSLKKESLKIEFTYFPFPRIDEGKIQYGIRIDSVLDIAVNKVFTIYQNARSRDFTDLYMICKRYNFSIKDLIEKAKVKFDWHIDPLKLGSQFLFARELKDYPQFIHPISENDWQSFFIAESKKLKGQIIE